MRRDYRDLIADQALDRRELSHPFIERLTHDAYFIQIPKITGSTATSLESVLSIFDQSRKVEGDGHRLEVDDATAKADNRNSHEISLRKS